MGDGSLEFRLTIPRMTTPLPRAFNHLAGANLAAQSAEQLSLAAVPIVAVLALGLAQWPLMAQFLRQPVERALHVSAFGVPLFVSGMMVSAWGLRQLYQQGLL